MTAILNMARRWWDRWPTPRRGSVLILVVAVLVLMALIGTAYIATARLDRHSARQNVANTQIDMLVDAVVDLISAKLVEDLSVAGENRPRWRGKYGHWDAYGVSQPSKRVGPLLDTTFEHAYDEWLASRIPRLVNPIAQINILPPPTDSLVNNPPIFDSVSYPLTENGPNAPYVRVWQFDSPYLHPHYPNGTFVLSLPKGRFEPTYLEVPPGSGTLYPAFYMRHPRHAHLRIDEQGVANPLPPGTLPFMGADADGDGVADSGLIRFPMSSIDGITYYYAYRLIDNNSAINVNTAYSRMVDFNADGDALLSSFTFPANVALVELLRSIDPSGDSLALLGIEMQRLSAYRMDEPFGGRAAGVIDSDVPDPSDDDGTPRGDFRFVTMGDAQWMQLARRLANPGINYLSGPTAHRYQAFPIVDSTALAYRFSLRNPTVSRSTLENTLFESLNFGPQGRPVRTSPYPLSQAGIAEWFWFNFWYDSVMPADAENAANAVNTFRSRRTLFVTRNPVSNHTPAVRTDGLQVIRPVVGLADGSDPWRMPANPGTGATRNATPKACVNTASFGELWKAYWKVMSEGEHGLEFPFAPIFDLADGMPGAPLEDPYLGSKFDEYVPGAISQFAPEDSNYDREEYHDFLVGGSMPSQSPEGWHPARMFRSSIRPVYTGGWGPETPRFLPLDQMLLRAALAAVNTEDLRDSDQHVTGRKIVLTLNDTVPVEVWVYGMEAQPFITEVFAHTETGETTEFPDESNPFGYVAIELYNPYDFDIPLRNWKIAAIDRQEGTDYPLSLDPNQTLIADLSDSDDVLDVPDPLNSPLIVPARGFLILENYSPSAVGTALYRPTASGLPRFGPIHPNAQPGDTPSPLGAENQINVACVPGLSGLSAGGWTATGGIRSVLNREMVLLRPRRADGEYSKFDDPTFQRAFNEDPLDNPTGYLADMVPVDSFDFTGLRLPVSSGLPGLSGITDNASAWHYVRQTDDWRFVYPGRYDGNPGFDSLGNPRARQQGTQQVSWPSGSDADPWNPTNLAYIAPSTPPTLGQTGDASNPEASYPQTFPVPWPAFAGENPIGPAGSVNHFPFGGFARNGDILQVPFIGSYVVRPLNSFGTGEFYEINPATLDSAFAEDTDQENDEVEQIGRFCPIHLSPTPYDYAVYQGDDTVPVVIGPVINNDYGFDSSSPLRWLPWWRYRWAADLFDYVTVQAPHSDYLANYPTHETWIPGASYAVDDIVEYEGDLYRAHTPNATTSLDPANWELLRRTPVRNEGTTGNEHDVPVEGLININTASWKVLAALPLVVNPAGDVNVAATEALAKAIVYFRDVDARLIPDWAPTPFGPFKTIFELNRVPGFQNALGALSFGADDDFTTRYQQIARISNLITTRSDSFTCYILIQGWRGAGTTTPELVVQRRVAYIFDRSRIPFQREPRRIVVPND